VAKATTYKDIPLLTHTVNPFFAGHSSDGVFFVAVRKSFLICFHGFVQFLNPGVLRLEFFGCADGLA